MLLTADQFHVFAHIVQDLDKAYIGFDFETDGLRPYQGAQAFLMGFTDELGNKYSVYLKDVTLDAVENFFSNPDVTYCAHNAKFEMGFLHEQFGTEIKGQIWDTEVMARVEKNNELSYSLQACAQRLKLSKHEPMLEWLKIRGNKDRYHQAPQELIVPYCEQDARLSWELARHQRETFQHWDKSSPAPIVNIVKLEKQVLKPLFEMEKNGLLVDVGYCMRALEYEKQEIERAKKCFQELSGVEFMDSRKTLQPVFDSHGILYGKTELGNASFTEENLSASQAHPIVGALLAHRRAIKRSSAYWANFIDLEQNGIIHPSINQNRAQTGRMSISDPSAQNWSTDEDPGTSFPIRRAFIARPNCRIASLDYSQMELRKASDEAEDHPMIERIQAGADLHQEIADMAGVSRSLAKNGRFAKQYGAGVKKIAATLGVPMHVAQMISDAIDQQASRTAAYSRMLSKNANPFGSDWLGRRFYFDTGFEYKAFNYRIQGGCAEILKIAILSVDEFLKKNASPETFILLVVHDEIVLNIHEKDLVLLPEIKRLMIEAHRDKKFLSMDVSVAIGPNFHDLEAYESAT